MFLLLLLSALALWAVVSTVVAVRADGYGARPTNWTRVAEHGEPSLGSQPDPLQRAGSTRVYR